MICAYFKGMCEPNYDGGTMVYTVLIYRNGVNIHESCHQYKSNENNHASNNIADYCGLICILKFLISLQMQNEKIIILTNSTLIVGHMQENWNIKEGKHEYYANKAKGYINNYFPFIEFKWKSIKDTLENIDGIMISEFHHD